MILIEALFDLFFRWVWHIIRRPQPDTSIKSRPPIGYSTQLDREQAEQSKS